MHKKEKKQKRKNKEKRKIKKRMGKVRFVCISDTHNLLHDKINILDGDVLIHGKKIQKRKKEQKRKINKKEK